MPAPWHGRGGEAAGRGASPPICSTPGTLGHSGGPGGPSSTDGLLQRPGGVGGPRRVQGGRGQAAQASGGHPGWEGDPLGSPGSFGRIGIRHGGGLADRWDTPAAARENGPGIPGWGERVQCPDLGLHGDAPPSGSPGGCQLGPARGSPGGPGGPVEGPKTRAWCPSGSAC